MSQVCPRNWHLHFVLGGVGGVHFLWSARPWTGANKAGFPEGSMTVSLEGRTAVGEACVVGEGGGTRTEASREGTQDGRAARLLEGTGWRMAQSPPTTEFFETP